MVGCGCYNLPANPLFHLPTGKGQPTQKCEYHLMLISENQQTTITKSNRRMTHYGRLAPSCLAVLGFRLVMEFSYMLSLNKPFSSQPQYTTLIPVISYK